VDELGARSEGQLEGRGGGESPAGVQGEFQSEPLPILFGGDTEVEGGLGTVGLNVGTRCFGGCFHGCRGVRAGLICFRGQGAWVGVTGASRGDGAAGQGEGGNGVGKAWHARDLFGECGCWGAYQLQVGLAS